MEFRQVLRTRPDGTLMLAPSVGGRIALAAVGGVLVLMMLVTGQFSWVAAILGAICLVASVAEDAWHVRPSERDIVHRRGLIFFSAGSHYPASGIETLRIREMGSKMGRFQYLVFEIVLNDGSVTTVEVRKRRRDELVTTARRVASALELPLDEES
ncbi:MAG: hypothetical protein ACOC2Y_04100 [Spirochaetota bacterium]